MPQADDIGNKFGFTPDPKQAESLNKIKKEVATGLIAKGDALKVAFPGIGFVKIMKLSGLLAKLPDVEDAIDALLAIEAVFDLKDPYLHFKLLTQPKWPTYLAKLTSLSATSKGHFRTFYANKFAKPKHSDNSFESCFNFLNKAAATGDLDHTLGAVVAAVANGLDLQYVTDKSLPLMSRLFKDFGPTAKFKGFTEWGPGDAGSAVDNLKTHFFKHVCCYDSVKKTMYDKTDSEEALEWWVKLKLTGLTRKEYLKECQKHPTQGDSQVQGDLANVGNWFAPGDGGKLIPVKLREFVDSGVLVRHEALRNLVRSKGESLYDAEVQKDSASLTGPFVFTDGEGVWLAGSKTFFLFMGRLDENNGFKLGISTCYAADDIKKKLTGLRSRRVWDLKQ